MLKKTSKLLVIGHVWPQPKATAAGEHMVHLLLFFQKMNYEILFVSSAQMPEKYSVLNKLNIKTEQILINNDDFDSLLLAYAPTIVLFDRFMTEEQFSWRIYKNCPDALRVLDTEDLHFLRNEREETLKRQKTNQLTDIFKREIASIYRSDLSLIISKSEIQILTQNYRIPKEILMYLPLLSIANKTIEAPNFKNRKDLIFVGNFLHKPNWNCVQYLKKEIWPELSKLLPNIKLHIFGSHASQKHLQLSNVNERFIVHGYTNDISTELQKAKLLIAPLLFGAGQKGKLLKAMESGLPNITTSIGSEGMFFNNKWAGIIADDPKIFIAKAATLYKNEELWLEAQDKCFEIITANFDFETHFLLFKKGLQKLQNNLSEYRSNNITGQILWHHNFRSTEFMSRWIMEKNKTK